MFQYVLFDLDGTLTDPREGITKSVQFALAQQGISEPDLQKLEPFIGPPLKDSFMEFYQMTEEQASKGIEDYRKRFSPIGKYENTVYPGIPEMLAALKRAGMKLAVASSKPEVFVRDILKHFQLDSYFDVVTGSELDGTRSRKEEVVEEALRRLTMCSAPDGTNPADRGTQAVDIAASVNKESCAMVGDRKFDIQGGRQFGLTTVGVTYGYAGKGELEAEGADYIVKNPAQLARVLLGEQGTPRRRQRSDRRKQQAEPGDRRQSAAGESAFHKTWDILSPLIVYYIGYNVCYMVIVAAIQMIAGSGSASEIWLHDNSVLILNLGRMCSMLVGMLFVLPMFCREAAHRKRSARASFVIVGVLAVFAALGINILFTLLHITELSESFAHVSEQQFLMSVWQGLALFGVVAPLAEELVFRGVIYNRLKKYFPVWLSILTSSFLFGGYHGNLVQGMYGFLMGALIAWLYELTGDFRVPVVFHSFANVSVFLGTYDSRIAEAVNTWPNFMICLVISGLAAAVIYRKA